MAGITELRALFFVLAIFGAVVLLRPRLGKGELAYRILGYWGITAIGLFAINILWLNFAIIIAALLLLTPTKSEDRAVFFICTLFAVPTGLTWLIPFPGINYLFELNHIFLQSVIVLLPILLIPNRFEEKQTLPSSLAMNLLVLSMFIISMVLSSRGIHASPTNVLRNILISATTILIPYFAVVKAFSGREVFEKLLKNFTIVACIFTFLGVMTVFHNWNYYTAATDGFMSGGSLYRGGDTRVLLTLRPTLAAIFMIVSLLLFLHFTVIKAIPKWIGFGWMVLALFVFVQTEMRSGYVGGVLAFATILFFLSKTMIVRGIFVLSGLFVAAGAGIFLMTTDLNTIDNTGTFEYRQKLFIESVKQIQDQPIFGNADYRLLERFEPLRQGEGIIDFVNTYLQYALEFGLVGLIVYVFLYAFAGINMLRASDRIARIAPQDKTLHHMGIGLGAVFLMSLCVILFTSPTSYMQQSIYLFIALGVAYDRLSKSLEASSLENNTTTEEIISSREEPSFTPPQKKPPFEIDIAPGVKGWPG